MSSPKPLTIRENLDLIGIATDAAAPKLTALDARFALMSDVVHTLHDRKPVDGPIDNDGVPFHAPIVMGLIGLPEADLALALGDADARQQFAGWRVAVTNAEARDARELLVLGEAVRFFVDQRGSATDPESVDAYLGILGEWLNSVWRTDVPLRSDLRRWAQRRTRRYDLCPKEWRTMQVREGK